MRTAWPRCQPRNIPLIPRAVKAAPPCCGDLAFVGRGRFRILRSLTLRVVILPDYESLSRWAAELVLDRIRRFEPTADRPFVLGLPTGSTPLGLYQELVRRHRAGEVSFQNVVTFNM